MKSQLPSQREVADVQRMRIYRTRLSAFKYRNVKTHIDFVDEQTGKRTPVSPNIYRIDDPKSLGYMPSKIWHHDGEFNLLFYTNPLMPDTARPFGKLPSYAFTLFVRDGTSIEYDWQTRIFIDQIPTNIGMAYMFIFAEVDAKSILQTQWDGEAWPVARPGLREKDFATLEQYGVRDPSTFVCDASDMAQC